MKKIVNTVLVLVLVVLMALSGFVYYAWMVQKRSKSAAELMTQTNAQIDSVRFVSILETNYTTYIRDMLLMNQSSLPSTANLLPGSMKSLLTNIRNNTEDTASRRILGDLLVVVEEKNAYNQQIVAIAATQPALAKQLVTAEKEAILKTNIRKKVNDYISENRRRLITRIEKDTQYTRYSFWTTVIISLFTLVLLLGESRYIYRLFVKLKSRANRLYKREQSFMRLAEETELILYKAGLDGIFTYVSKRTIEITGFTAAELIGQHYSIFLEPNTWKQLDEFYTNQVKTGDDYTFIEFEIITKSGTKKWVEQLATLIYNEDGRIKEFQCIVRDIDKEKRNEDQAMYLQKRLDAIVDYMPAMMFIKDVPGKYLLVNNRFTEMHGVQKKDVIGKTDAELPYDWVAKYAALDREVLATKSRVKVEDIITHNGIDYHFIITKFPLRNAEGEMIGICGIGTDFTEKAKYIIAVEEANKQAQEAINAQEMFLANMSHEIRTPMNGIIGMSNLLMQQQLTTSQLEYTSAIKTSANHLLVIINEILDFSKIKAGKLHLQNESFDIYEVIDNTLFPLKLQAQQKGLSFFDEIDNNVPTYLMGDEIRLAQILTNLVENAIKFTHHGKVMVKVSLVAENKDASTLTLGFEIKDTGIGIAPEQHDMIFQSFSQSHTDNTRKFGGTGLGLAISKELIELQKGSIRVDSQLDEGACFYFELPFTRSTGEINERDKKVNLVRIDKPLQGKTILVVEDNDINQQVVFHTLRNAGARTDVVNSGKAGLEMVDYKSYDCIIMDIQMPGMDGYQTTQAIRNKGIQSCIIAMTASALKGEKERCLQAGMNDYISKPFDRDDLFHKILKGLGESVPDPDTKLNAPIPVAASLDFTTVYNMMSGEKEHVKILLEELLDGIPKKFLEMNNLVTEQDWQPLYMLAHQMKFNLNVAGLQHASNMAYTIERDARLEENLDTIPSRLNEIMNTYYQHAHLIKEHVDQC
ncbi:MAG: PAS domain S-box protein [Chitinophaga sp.]|uniref:PAS domain S-box protein n=1 Tax=Chitinophaga sp. TaxID=1869181 RepID=UPI001B24E348|nr:PAS domain S-box protein [Chitinophaga sp.]MBO9728939.1 PAS domain S-box protein [Chitinophaga sp.]